MALEQNCAINGSFDDALNIVRKLKTMMKLIINSLILTE